MSNLTISSLIEFSFYSAISIGMLGVLGVAIFELYKHFNQNKPNFDGEVKPTKPWPGNSGCASELRPKITPKGVDNSDLNELLAMATKAVSDSDHKEKPKGPPNTKLNGDPL